MLPCIVGRSRSDRSSLRRFETICVALAGIITTSRARAQPPDDPPREPPPLKPLRYDEDYSYLRDPAARTNHFLALEPLKYIPLNRTGDWYLSLGGEARHRFEYFHNLFFGAQPGGNAYLLQRYQVHGDLHLGPSLRGFVQPRLAVASFMSGPPVPQQDDGFDIQQGFVEAHTAPRRDGSVALALRVGRQEMSYGTERLISVREATNVRRAFNAARLLTHFFGWQVDGFFARLVENLPGKFDPWFRSSTNFWGLYATGPTWPQTGMNLDVYYLGLDRDDAAFEQGIASELRHTTGVRLFGEVSALDYNFEGIYQWGDFGSGNIRAWGWASDMGYSLTQLPLAPRIGMRANVISGDRNPNDNTLGTFNPLFPRGNYFGESAVVGPVNLADVHPILRFHVTDTLALDAAWAFFWRSSTSDGFYDNGLNLIQPAAGSERRFIGSELSVVVDWHVHRQLRLRASYSHFFTGAFLEETGPGLDVDFVLLIATLRF